MHIVWKAVSSHLFLWPKGVSDNAHCAKGSLMTLITSFPMTNRQWVTLHILWKAVSSHLFLWWPTACEWHCTFCWWQSHHIFSCDQQLVSDIVAHFVEGHLISSFPTTNRKWVTLHISSEMWSHHIYQQRVSGHCTFCGRQSHHIFSLWQTGSKWHYIFYERQSHPIFFYYDQLSLWVTLHILWKAV